MTRLHIPFRQLLDAAVTGRTVRCCAPEVVKLVLRVSKLILKPADWLSVRSSSLWSDS